MTDKSLESLVSVPPVTSPVFMELETKELETEGPGPKACFTPYSSS
jgi:hypothetical protein